MPLQPTGILSRPLVAMRDLVAASASFQAWVGASDANAAAQRVHLLVAPAHAVRPFALIDFGDVARERVSVTNRKPWQDRSGSNLLLWIQAEAGGAEEPDATIAFCNAVGALLSDLESASGDQSAPTPSLIVLDLAVPPRRIEEEDRQTQGDYFECCAVATYTRAA